MSRSLKKGPFVDTKLLQKVVKQSQIGIKDPIKTWSRRSTIVPEFVGYTFLIHNGKVFNKLFVSEEMVGHKLGEFSMTRIFRGHSGIKTEAAAAGGPSGPAAPAGAVAGKSPAAAKAPAKPAGGK
jgi:small subunit ribosomal protein S19